MRCGYASSLALLLALAGCVDLKLPAPELHDYRLEYAPPSTPGTSLPVTLHVPPLGVAASYDRMPIVYRTDAYTLSAYYYHRWSATPGQMVADLLARDLAASGLYRAVQQAPSIVPSDYELNGEVQVIEERATPSGCVAALELRVALLRTRRPGGDAVALNRSYHEEEAAGCRDPHAVVAAMSTAMERISEQLQHDLYEVIRRDKSAG